MGLTLPARPDPHSALHAEHCRRFPREGPVVTVDRRPHPFLDTGRETKPVIVPRGETLAGLMARELPGAPDEVEVLVDGRWVPYGEWERVTLRGGELVSARIGVGKSAFRTILTIAVIAAAIFVPPALGLAAGSFAAAAVGAGISLVGGLIVNALAPVRPPDLGGIGSGQAAGAAAAEPVYSLSGGGNRARLNEPMGLVLGQHRVFPDLGAKEYTEFEGGEQYLNGIYHFGLGDLEISDIREGETLLSAYEEVETEFATGEALTLFPGNVDTIQGATSLEDTDWVLRQTAAGTTRIAVDIVARLYAQNSRTGAFNSRSVTIEIGWFKTGGTADARALVLAGDGQDLVRRTISIDLPEAAAWNVRVRRTTAKSDDRYVRDEVQYAALRAYQPDTGAYAGETRMAVRIRASRQIHGRLNRISALVKQKVPTWDGSEWSETTAASSNPAAVFRAYARGIRSNDAGVAGAWIADARIDHDGLGRWHEWCEAQQLRCDLDLRGGSYTHDQVLGIVAECGRASMSWSSGKLGVVFEDANRAPSGLVTPGNIIAGSFRVDWAPAVSIADEIAMRYLEPGMDWGWNTVTRRRPGLAGEPQRRATVTLRGVTTARQAAMFCNLQAARQFYHRRRMSWIMSREGRSFSRGDVVWITHSLIDGGQAGRLAGGEGDRLILDKEVDITPNSWLMLRTAKGKTIQTPVTGVGANPTSEVRMTRAPLLNPAVEAPALDTLWRLYDAALPPVKARIIAVQPQSNRRFKFTAIDEVAAYHTLATSDLTAPFPALPSRLPRVTAVEFSPRQIRVGAGYVIELEAALTVQGDWRGAAVYAGPTANDLQLVDTLIDGAVRARWIVPPGSGQVVRIVPGTEAAPAGPAWTGQWMLDAGPPPPPVTGFSAAVDDEIQRIFSWTPPDWPDLAGVVIRYHQTANQPWSGMLPLHRGILTASPLQTLAPASGTYDFVARTISTLGALGDEVRIRLQVAGARSKGVSEARVGEIADAKAEAAVAAIPGEETIWAITAADLKTLPATLRPSDDWGYRQPGTASDLAGGSGDDGGTGDGKREYVFTSSDAEAAPSGANNLPDPDWNFDEPNLRGGILRGAYRYYDGIPPDLSPARPWVFRFHRTPPGSPAPGDDVGTLAWTAEAVRNESAIEYLHWLSREPDAPDNGAVWKCTRDVVGQPSTGDDIPASWRAPARVAISRPRQWTRLWGGEVTFLPSRAVHIPLAGEIDDFSYLAFGAGTIEYLESEQLPSFDDSPNFAVVDLLNTQLRVRRDSPSQIAIFHTDRQNRGDLTSIWGISSPDDIPTPPDDGWSEGIEVPGGVTNSAGGIAFDSAGNLYVGDSRDDRIYRRAGGYSGVSWDAGIAIAGGAVSISDIAFDGDGNLYMMSASSDRIYRRAGGYGGASWDAGIAAPPNGGTGGITFGASGDLYAVGFDQRYRIYRRSGGYSGARWDAGILGPDAAAESLYSLVFDSSGALYVGGNNYDRIYQRSGGYATGPWDRGIPLPAALTWPRGIAFDPDGNLYVLDGATGRIYRRAGGYPS